MYKSVTTIFCIILVDAIGISLIIPVLPTLLHTLHSQNVARDYGLLLSLYALFQVIFSPILGALSDRFGRRPILIISLIGMTINYCLMAEANHLWILYLGRIISGITASNMTVANTYITDVTPLDQRAKRFGMIQAVFGLGFIIGPIVGGAIGNISVHAPFALAAFCSGSNLFLACFFLPESHHVNNRSPITWKKFIPLRSLLWIANVKNILSYIAVFSLLTLASQSPQSLWVLYVQERFSWRISTIGLSIAFFGFSIAICQAMITGIAVKRLGEKKTFIFGMILEIIFFSMFAIINRGWMLLAIIPIGALATIGSPSLRAMITQYVSKNQQGELQGTLTSITSVASIISPLVCTYIYNTTKLFFPGLAWLSIGCLFFLCLMIFISIHHDQR